MATGEQYEDERHPIGSGRIAIFPDESTGAFITSIPIKVPPGRKGIEPSLSLTYNSQNQEHVNIAGFGWNIGIPHIERINREGVEGLYSASTSGFLFRSSLDGELGRKEPATTTEDYGAKVETGPFRAYEYKSHTWWRVTDKNGIIYTFGTSTLSRLDDPNDSTKVYRWLLERMEDPNGNYMTYEYTKDKGQVYPSKITYTGKGADRGIFEVEFLKESRSDIATSTVTGFPVVSRYRIYEIQTKVNNSWVHKYELGYTTGDNGVRSLLSSVTETGRHEDTGATVSLPPTQFTYQRSRDDWFEDTNYSTTTIPAFIDSISDNGLRIADINNDALPDLLHMKASGAIKKVYLNDGDDTGWTEDTGYDLSNITYYIVDGSSNDDGVRAFDINGDLFSDLIRKHGGGNNDRVDINNADGTGWTLDTAYSTSTLPEFIGGSGVDTGVRIFDVNGDGLADLTHMNASGAIKKVYLNDGDGTGWTEDTGYDLSNLPDFVDANSNDTGIRISDINGDGLADLIRMYSGAGSGNGVFINDGDGTGWTKNTSYDLSNLSFFVDGSGNDDGLRLMDLNADGLPDLIRIRENAPDNNRVYINKGDGTGWTEDTTYATSSLPHFISQNGYDSGVRIIDINGDGILDLLWSRENSTIKRVYIHRSEKADLLHQVRSSQGATTTITYKGSPEFTDGSNNLLNPHMPFSLDLVEAVGVSDGFGATATTTYTYGGGEYYFNGPYDREFAGFATTTNTDPLGFVTKTFYHQQGSTTQSTIGEYQDHIAKKGKPYRIEVYDASNNLYQKTINAWDRTALDYQRNYVYLARATDMTYDGDADHKDKAETYRYNTSTGNLTYKQEWAEVTGSDDGSFTASSTDRFGTTITYASSSTVPHIGFPSQETVVNNASTTVKDMKFYYDSLANGSVTKGNETKREFWKTGATWIDTEKTYNSYGLVTQGKDPRDKATNYTYDSNNVYIATSTNPVNLSTGFVYDYSSGKVKRTNNPHNYIFETTYDGLDRPTEEKQPDATTPSTLITNRTLAYTDTIGSRRIQETRSLNSATSTDTYTYLDGLDRTMQERVEAEDSNTYAAKDFQYDRRGKLHRESLPYFSTGSSRTTASANQNLYATTIYDTLDRPTAIGTAVGTTTYAYDQWRTTITDPESNIKRLASDGYGNLFRVEEVNGSSTYIARYEYNYLKNLTKITDDQTNIRNFTYDGLGRRTAAGDLHALTDTSYGTTTYTYDDAGNVTSQTDPKEQTINYTYDDINRPLTEDYTGGTGTEITYSYDTCDNGKGLLCGATTTAAGMNYTYDPLGRIKTERHATTSIFTTTYTHNRQGNIIDITYPDNALVTYVYNTTGQLETVSKRENGTTTPIMIVKDTEYGPTGAVTFRDFGNGTETTWTYDATKLYRLTNILTTASTTVEDFGIGGIGDVELPAWAAAGPELDPDMYSPETFGPRPRNPRTSDDVMPPPAALDNATSTTDDIFRNPSPDAPAKKEESPEPSPAMLPQPAGDDKSTTTPKQSTDSPAQTPQAETQGVTEEPITSSSATTTDGISPSAIATSSLPADDSLESLAVASTSPVETLLQGKTAEEKATIKGQEIAKLDSLPRTARPDYDIEIISLQAIDKGVVAFARAWNKQNEQIGFGQDGSIDIERFQIINPPILVGDPQGDIVRTWTTRDGEIKEQRFREDLKEALLQSLEHTIKVKQQKYRSEHIIAGKIGNTTSTFYPDADPESTSVDGRATYQTGFDSTWATARDATAGTSASDTETSSELDNEEHPIQNNQYLITRAFSLFDTSSIPDVDTIDSVTYSIYFSSKSEQDNDAQAYMAVCRSNPASETALGTADYDQIKGTDGNFPLGTGVAIQQQHDTGQQKDITNITTGQYTDWTLNATGIGNVSKTGITKFCHGHGHDFENISIAQNSTNRIVTSLADASGTTQDPKLVVEHTDPNIAPSAPTDLLTEGQTNPVNISDPTPEFSAIHNDPDDGDIATHYRIQVATSSNFSSTYWDTGQTALASSTPEAHRIADISYAGSALASSTTYYWRIKFWDDSSAEGAWSTATSTFLLADPSGGSSGALQNISYTYDNVGNITKITDYSDTGYGKTVLFTYDDLNRLLTASTTAASSTPYRHTYAYTSIGNIASSTEAGTYHYEGSSYANPHAATKIVATSTPPGQPSEIAFDATSKSGTDFSSNVTSLSWSHTTSGSDRLLFVGCGMNDGADADANITNVTYNAVAGTEIRRDVANADGSEIWYVVNPTTGANTISVTFAGTVSRAGCGAISLTGVDQSSPLDANNGSTYINNGSPSINVTTVADNAWVLDTVYSNFSTAFGDLVVGTGQTERIKIEGTFDQLGGSHEGPKTPAGNVTMSWSGGSTGSDGGLSAASFKPAGGSSSATTSLIYDNNGNLTNYGSSTTHTWNYRNQLIQTTKSGNTTSYGYDYQGNRASLTTGGITTKYVNRLYSTNGATTTKHIFAGDTLIATVERIGSATTTHIIHTDHLGGTNVVTDANGDVVQTIDYYPYGALRINNKTSTMDEVRKFTGHEYDSGVGLNYMRARYQDPGRGQFLSMDPAARDNPNQFLNDPQQFNTYSYARNNPLVLIDPLGLFIIETGEIEEGDTLGEITDIINRTYGTSYSHEDVAKLNGIEDINKIYAGDIIIPNQEIPDITNDLSSKMRTHAADRGIQNPFYFRRKVKEKGEWDLKNQPGIYCSKIHCGGQEHSNYVFRGERVDYDAPGNIHYGYVGSNTWYTTPYLLHYFADKAQNSDNNTNTGDTAPDRGYIDYGIALFNIGY